MGFTRNYKNLLMTYMCNPYNYTNADFSAIDTTKFDDTTFKTLKDTTGTIRRWAYGGSYGFTTGNSYGGGAIGSNQITIGLLAGPSNITSSYSSNSAKRIVFGTNDAEETEDDYTLSEITTISFDLLPKLASNTYENKKQTNNYSCVISNSSDVTINELGIYIKGYSHENYLNGPGSNKYDYLLYRKKLDTPIELKAGEPQLVTFSIEFDYPA